MFELIFTFFVNIVGDFFDKKFLTFKYAIGFLLILNMACVMVVFGLTFTPNERLALMVCPNIMFFFIWMIVRIFGDKMK